MSELPAEAALALDNFDSAVADVEASLHEITANTRLLEELDATDPVAAAKLRVTLAYTINSLFFMFMKTQGLSSAEHPVTAEIARVRQYIEKVKALDAKGGGATTGGNTAALLALREGGERVPRGPAVHVVDDGPAAMEVDEEDRPKDKSKDKSKSKEKSKEKSKDKGKDKGKKSSSSKHND
eukprot:c40196_g1_i1.p2 GENE.c40196_g1_i1~~c40196_g1_i1.p2  ORF type:complete len:182 (+),score=60.67 c40196_g1_i1:150-695(+)